MWPFIPLAPVSPLSPLSPWKYSSLYAVLSYTVHTLFSLWCTVGAWRALSQSWDHFKRFAVYATFTHLHTDGRGCYAKCPSALTDPITRHRGAVWSLVTCSRTFRSTHLITISFSINQTWLDKLHLSLHVFFLFILLLLLYCVWVKFPMDVRCNKWLLFCAISCLIVELLCFLVFIAHIV